MSRPISFQKDHFWLLARCHMQARVSLHKGFWMVNLSLGPYISIHDSHNSEECKQARVCYSKQTIFHFIKVR